MNHEHDEQIPIAIPLDDLKHLAAHVAEQLQAARDTGAAPTGGGSAHRGLAPEVQKGFITVRAALFQRGIYDPVLVRFDSTTAPPASTAEIAQQLRTVAASL